MSKPAQAGLLRSAPYFPVADVDKTAAYYRDVLGFTSEYVAGSPAEFAISTRDGFSVMLRRVESPERITPNEAQGGTWDAFFWTNDAAQLRRALLDLGAEVVYAPMIQAAYHMREFAVRDCDGHVLGFGQQLDAGDTR